MKITFSSKEHKRFQLWFPSCLVLNSVTAVLLAHMIKRKAGRKVLSVRQLCRIFRAINKERKRSRDAWQLISVTTHDDLHITVVP